MEDDSESNIKIIKKEVVKGNFSNILAEPKSTRSVKSNKSKNQPIKMEFDGMKEMEDEVSVRPREESEEDSDL